MLTARIKIGDAYIADTRDYGLIYLDSDKVVGPQSKGFETTQYPEEEGEHVIPKTVDAPFDYKVKFFIDPSVPAGTPPENSTVSQKIRAFNNTLFYYVTDLGGQETSVKEYNKVVFYNDYKRHKIVGYPKEISEATEFWRDPSNQLNDIVVVEFTIRVVKPSECNFYAAQ